MVGFPPILKKNWNSKNVQKIPPPPEGGNFFFFQNNRGFANNF